MTHPTPTDLRTRLAALRREIAGLGLAAFLVPRADEYQGEYVPPSAERLRWLTGFTGSAGIAAVLADRAAIFVDGRYSIQVRQQVDLDLWTPLHLVDQPLPAWLADQLGGPTGAEVGPRVGPRVGVDPWLHTADGLERLRAALTPVGAELVLLDFNPLDTVWTDRPAPPRAPILPQPLSLTGRDSLDKRLEIAQSLARSPGREPAEAVVLTQPDSIAWLLNVRGGDVPHTPLPLSFAVLRGDGSVRWLVDPDKLSPTTRAALDPGVSIHPPAALGAELDALAGTSVLVDPATAAAWIFRRLEQAGATIRRGADPCMLPKACKTDAELTGSRGAHRRDGAALTGFLIWLSSKGVGRTEIDIADELLRRRRADPAFRDESFPTIAGCGPNGAIVHYRAEPASARTLTPGSLLLLDSGAQYLDGTTDVTRTVLLPGPVEPALLADMRDRFTRVLKGHIAIAQAVFPVGTSGAQLDALARLALWQAGIDYDHGTGHGVGAYLSVHEGPQRISKSGGGTALKPGMIVSNEPGYYKTGAYGIRIENLLVVVPRDIDGAERDMLGFDTLTLAPIDRRLIAPDLLDARERAWVNQYHTRVRAELTPLLPPELHDALVSATLAI